MKSRRRWRGFYFLLGVLLAYVAAWEYTGDTAKPTLHKETLQYEEVHLAVRSYV